MTADTARGDAAPVSERAPLLLVLLLVPIAAAISNVAYATYDLHADLTEYFAWGLDLAWGYDKHPPLGAWITAAWFSVFPATDWAFSLLAALNAAAGLYCVDLVARQYLTPERRLLCLALLLLTPAYSFHGMRYNASNLLLWAWPLATFCFLRAFATRRILWAAAAGATASAAMLAKYYSGVLIAGFVVAALLHPDRWRYLRSPSPWISTAVGFALLAPNLAWLVAVEGSPVTHAVTAHGGSGAARVLSVNLLYYLPAALAYAAGMLAAYAYAVRPQPAAALASLWPQEADRRLLATIFLVITFLPLLLGVALGLRLVSLWAMLGFFPLPVLLLAPFADISRRRIRHVVGVVFVIAAVAALLAPLHAWHRLTEGSRDNRDHYSLVAREVGRLWREVSDRPLAFAGGDRALSTAASFYLPDHPRFISRLDDASPGSPLAAAGVALICPERLRACIADLDAWAAQHPAARRERFTVTARFWGIEGRTAAYVALLVPPDAR